MISGIQVPVISSYMRVYDIRGVCRIGDSSCKGILLFGVSTRGPSSFS